MITVKCGYEGCEWKLSTYDIWGKYSSGLEAQMPEQVNLQLESRYLAHCVEAHNVPPAIWEK